MKLRRFIYNKVHKTNVFVSIKNGTHFYHFVGTLDPIAQYLQIKF